MVRRRRILTKITSESESEPVEVGINHLGHPRV
jgi:hypothetical protein